MTSQPLQKVKLRGAGSPSAETTAEWCWTDHRGVWCRVCGEELRPRGQRIYCGGSQCRRLM